VADNTDVYAFRSPDRPDTVTLIADFIPFEAPYGGPNFFNFGDDVRYLVNIDNDGDARADIVYEWRFQSHRKYQNTFLYNVGQVTSLDDPDLNVFQLFTLTRWNVDNDDNATPSVVGSGQVAPSYVGNASMPNYPALADQAIYTFGGTRAFAGQADDPFYLDLRVFDLLYGTDLKQVGNDSLAGFNVHTVALQVPMALLTASGQAPRDANDPSAVIGVWSTTERQTMDGTWRQVSRLGQPLVNEVVIDLARKDAFNAIDPTKDAVALDRVVDPEVPKLIQAIYGIPAPPTPRTDLATIFLTGIKGVNQPANVTPSEMLRLNMMVPVTASPNRMGVLGGDAQGFPNGRRLTDDVIDIALQAVEGAAYGLLVDPSYKPAAAVATLGDGVNANDKEFRASFPYVAYPHTGSSTNTAK
jgi:hypothetical protein